MLRNIKQPVAVLYFEKTGGVLRSFSEAKAERNVAVLYFEKTGGVLQVEGVFVYSLK